MKLSSSQASAVKAWGEGNVCVIAGPGSGKTTVLVERFRWLVEEKGISPADILAITFTEKAANNMLERLAGNRAPSGSAPPAGSAGPLYQTAQILTIDAFCARLLRDHALPAGLDPNFQVLESWQADILLTQAIDEELNKVYAADPAGTRRFLEVFAAAGTYRGGMDLSQVHNQILSLHQMIRISGAEIQTPENSPAISRARDELAETLMQLGQRRGDPQLTSLGANTPPPEHHADPAVFGWFSRAEKALKTHKAVGPEAPLIKKLKKDLLPACRAEFLTRYHHDSRVWLAGVVRAAAANYESLKHRGGWVDFSDLESLAIRLLESEPARRPGCGHVLVDEYQDTNPLQGKLIRLLRSGEDDSRTRFFAVGDINQSIYGFRHADPDVFRNYRREMLSGRGVVIGLLDNFRSRPEILKLAEHLLSDPDGGVEQQTLAARRDFAPKTQPSVDVLITRDPQGDRARQWEVRRVAGRIRELMESLKIGKLGRAPCWADFAVLLRSRTLIDRFAEGFRQEGIPYELSAGQGFFETTEVRDLVNLLRTLRNPHDDIALAATLCSPFAGASDEDLFRMRLASGSAGLVTGLYQYSETPAGRAAAAGIFAERLAKYRSLRDEIPLNVLLSRFLHECGYETGLLQSENGRSKLANVRKFLRIAGQIAGQAASASRSRFSETVRAIVELQQSGVSEAEATGYDEKTDAVRLMTLHAAKGLEFPVVILPALDSSPPNTASAVSYSPAGGIGAKWLDPADGNAREDTPLKQFLTGQREKKKKEGDRLFYVAMTRAEEHLLLSASFGPRSPLKHWAKLIQNKLGLDFKTVDTEPCVKQYEGYVIRYCVSDQEPEPGGLAPTPAAGEIEWVQPREGFEQQDSEIAITSAALFRQCPRKYFLSRYLGIDSPRPLPPAPPEQSIPEQSRSPATGQPPASQFGRHVHQALAGSPLDEQSEPEVAALVHAFEQSDLGRRARQAKIVAREFTVVFPVGQHILRGQIDLWFDDGEGQILVDYKTDHVSGEEISGRASDYALQVQLYAIAILGAKGRLPDRAILYFLRPSVAVEVDLSPEAMEQARQSVAEVFSAQSSLDFPMHEGPQCQRCGYYQNHCPAE